MTTWSMIWNSNIYAHTENFKRDFLYRTWAAHSIPHFIWYFQICMSLTLIYIYVSTRDHIMMFTSTWETDPLRFFLYFFSSTCRYLVLTMLPTLAFGSHKSNVPMHICIIYIIWKYDCCLPSTYYLYSKQHIYRASHMWCGVHQKATARV